MENRRHSQYTKHPRVYARCYWGRFTDPEPDPEIVAARNAFVDEFDVIAYVGNERPLCGARLFDHCELYRCRSGYAYVVSPYGERRARRVCGRARPCQVREHVRRQRGDVRQGVPRQVGVQPVQEAGI